MHMCHSSSQEYLPPPLETKKKSEALTARDADYVDPLGHLDQRKPNREDKRNAVGEATKDMKMEKQMERDGGGRLAEAKRVCS